MGVTPAPDHLEARGTEQLRLVPEEAVETLALQRSQEAVLGSEDGEEEAVEVTASVAEPGDQGEEAGGTAPKQETQEARGNSRVVAGKQTKTRAVQKGMELGQNQEAALAPRRLGEAGREALEELEAALIVSSRPVLTPVLGSAPGCLAPVLLDAQKDVLKSLY